MISASTINEVIGFVYNDREYDKILRNIIYNSHLPNFHFDDVKNDIYTSVLLKDKQKIIDTFNKNEFIFYFTGIVKRQVRSYKSKTYYTYIKKSKNNDELNETHRKDNSFESRLNDSLFVENIQKFISEEINKNRRNKVYFEHFKMQYLDGLNPRMISEITNVSKQSVVNYVNAAKQMIIKKFNLEWEQ